VLLSAQLSAQLCHSLGGCTQLAFDKLDRFLLVDTPRLAWRDSRRNRKNVVAKMISDNPVSAVVHRRPFVAEHFFRAR
jgi:hypothetical protein